MVEQKEACCGCHHGMVVQSAIEPDNQLVSPDHLRPFLEFREKHLRDKKSRKHLVKGAM